MRSILAMLLVVAAAPVLAQQTLYKLIDKNGKVTYAEKPPVNFDGKVIRLDINPEQNTATLPKPGAKGEDARRETEAERVIRRPTAQAVRGERIREARDRMETVCRNYEQTRDNPSADDLQWIARGAADPRFPTRVEPKPEPRKPPPPPPPAGPPPPLTPPLPPPIMPLPGQQGKMTGARAVPTEEYAARLTQLEKDCSDARDNLARVERGEP